MIQPFLQPQLSVEPRYELLRGLVHVELLLHDVVQHGSGGPRDLHAPLHDAVTAATAHPHSAMMSRRAARRGRGELPPAGMREAPRRTPAAAELILQRRHEGDVSITWAAGEGLVVAHDDVVERLPYALPALHDVVLDEEAEETHRFGELLRHERWPVGVHACDVCHMWQSEVCPFHSVWSKTMELVKRVWFVGREEFIGMKIGR